eukprot:TRINITY_DN28933_c0_g3_i1.p1 TRINITY_DN28933_c0_g3~~TRINITY_DN28933_c0_g3_i1.p1  ORF type:complete len:799 (+),score=133.54 TRINITY_DN28933_c0_g3_i1:69-2465(+)
MVRHHGPRVALSQVQFSVQAALPMPPEDEYGCATAEPGGATGWQKPAMGLLQEDAVEVCVERLAMSEGQILLRAREKVREYHEALMGELWDLASSGSRQLTPNVPSCSCGDKGEAVASGAPLKVSDALRPPSFLQARASDCGFAPFVQEAFNEAQPVRESARDNASDAINEVPKARRASTASSLSSITTSSPIPPTSPATPRGKAWSEKVTKLRNMFESVDGPASGTISASELHALMMRKGATESQISREGLQSTFSAIRNASISEYGSEGPEIGEDDTSLDFDEFAAIVLQAEEHLYQFPEQVVADFQVIRNLVIKEDAKGTLADCFTHLEMLQKAPTPRFELHSKAYQRLDNFMAIIIVINTITIGWGTDNYSDTLRTIELIFNSLYMMELTWKLTMLGPFEFFFGTEWSWHWFDSTLCMFAAVDTALELAAAYAEDTMHPAVLSGLRLVRLLRLQRIVRLLRYRIFNELTLMLKSLAAGFRTLFWAIVLLFCVVYIFALVLRQLLADDIDDCVAGVEACSVELGTGLARHLHPREAEVLLGSVPNTMFTVFRCVSGDCVSQSGDPIAMSLYSAYGAAFVVPYCLAFLFVIIGIFNLIVAIFVETVIEAARMKRRSVEDRDSMQLRKKLQRLLMKFLNVQDDEPKEPLPIWKAQLQRFRQLFSVERSSQKTPMAGPEFDKKITKPIFARVIRDKEVKEILDDLDIGNGDRIDVFDVIDSDGNGELDLKELVVGLMKLRGGAEKSDVVAALLGVRGLQRLLKNYMADVSENFNSVTECQRDILAHLAKLGNEESDGV